MIALSIRFLAGRYHATPWDHHVNEGTVEWPPSPWRILRALLATSYRSSEELSREAVREALLPLTAPPSFQLPVASTAHVRHYMPTDSSMTKVFDSFVVVGEGAKDPGEVIVHWPDVELDAASREVLSKLAERVPYLGRAESWVEMRLVEGGDIRRDAWPALDDESPTATTQLLCAMAEDEYLAWRRGFIDGQAGQKKKVSPPESMWEALHADTGVLQKEGWSGVPGARWVRYGFAAEPCSTRSHTRRTRVSRPTLARFALRSPVLPSRYKTLAIGERMRQALLSRSDGLPVFAGRSADTGERLTGHLHAFYLPEDADGDGRIDHVNVWAPGGFDADAVHALQGLRRLWGDEGHDLATLLVALGERDDYAGALGGVLGRARAWESSTPFVLPRHPKRRAGGLVDSPHDQVRRAAHQLLGVEPIEVTELVGTDGKPLPWYRFYRTRKRGGGAQASSRGYGFRIVFDSPVAGPIALGYGAHFGLGQFKAVG